MKLFLLNRRKTDVTNHSLRVNKWKLFSKEYILCPGGTTFGRKYYVLKCQRYTKQLILWILGSTNSIVSIVFLSPSLWRVLAVVLNPSPLISTTKYRSYLRSLKSKSRQSYLHAFKIGCLLPRLKKDRSGWDTLYGIVKGYSTPPPPPSSKNTFCYHCLDVVMPTFTLQDG